MNNTKEIILCNECGGIGKISTNNRVAINESLVTIEKCNNCKGSGRMIKKITYEPYLGD